LICNSIEKIFSSSLQPQFGVLFDIDGVLTRGRKLLPYTRDAFRKLVTTSGQFRVPTIFVTNAGNELRSSKATKLSQILGIQVRRIFFFYPTQIFF
jgi:ribonucleotide monophosphatase NagD (HAD superfamily)